MKIVICDDEPFFLDIIEEYCTKFEQEYKIPIVLIKFINGKDVLTYYEQNKDIDLFILDIMMKGVNGLKVATEIRKEGQNVKIIFLTSAIQFAPSGYVIGASRYWLKPLSFKKFCQELQTLYDEIKKESKSYIIEDIGNTIQKVYFDEILYIETQNRKACIHKINSNYMSRTKLIEYERKLDERFIRCHAAYIVNMSYITKITGLEINLSNGEAIYMSKGKRQKFISAFASYLNQQELERF